MSEKPAKPQPDKSIVYGVVEGTELTLDLYMPRQTGPRPCVVLIHGGGWSGGNRAQFYWHASELAKLGYVAASVGYRLSGVAKYPAALDDCQRAVRWLRFHATELSVDPVRFGAMGSSAGGHLVACLGVRETRDDREPRLAGISSRVSCVVDVHGIHGFTNLAEHSIAGKCIEPFIGLPLVDAADTWADASPLQHVSASSAATLILHDPDDTVVPYQDSAAFAAALITAHRPVEFLPVPAAGHGFIYNHLNPHTQRVWPVIVSWLNRHLQP